MTAEMSPLNSFVIKRFREMSAMENLEHSYKFLWMDLILNYSYNIVYTIIQENIIRNGQGIYLGDCVLVSCITIWWLSKDDTARFSL